MVCSCPGALGRSCRRHVVVFQAVDRWQDRIDGTGQNRLEGTLLDVGFGNTTLPFGGNPYFSQWQRDEKIQDTYPTGQA